MTLERAKYEEDQASRNGTSAVSAQQQQHEQETTTNTEISDITTTAAFSNSIDSGNYQIDTVQSTTPDVIVSSGTPVLPFDTAAVSSMNARRTTQQRNTNDFATTSSAPNNIERNILGEIHSLPTFKSQVQEQPVHRPRQQQQQQPTDGEVGANVTFSPIFEEEDCTFYSSPEILSRDSMNHTGIEYTLTDGVGDSKVTSAIVIAELIEVQESASPLSSSPEIRSGNRNGNENGPNPLLSMAHPVNAVLVDNTTVVVNATALSINSIVRPYHVFTVALSCLVILSVIIGLSVYVSSTRGGEDIVVPSPLVVPTASPTISLLGVYISSTRGEEQDSLVPFSQSPTASPISPSTVVCFESTEELRNAVAGYLEGDYTNTIKNKYGTYIGSWCVDKITDFSFLFCSDFQFNTCTGFYNRYAIRFNEDITMWNTSSATNMSYMFSYATSFNQDLSSWDVSSVTDTSDMFSYASAFNQSLCTWGGTIQTSNNTARTADMFSGASSCFTQRTPNLTRTPPGPFCHPCT